MEDMARLALFEQNIRDEELFSKTLLHLLKCINNILDKPYDYELRTIGCESFEHAMDVVGFTDYLLYLGFEIVESKLVYPRTLSLNKLKMAQAAMERKLHFNGHRVIDKPRAMKSIMSLPQMARSKLMPTYILTTNNELLLKLQTLFNDVLQYEDEELQAEARAALPLVTLQLRAQDRMRNQQRKIKSGEIVGQDMTFDRALLMELVGWFKHSFFRWVDKPECEQCQGPTTYQRTTTMDMGTETCRVELFKCTRCSALCQFPRYNSVSTLLRTRRGRCGEWANCFTLMCRALGYDARYVYDVTDHVWTEVYDDEAGSWTHVDACEGRVGTPLMYERGWGKRLVYVLAASRDDVQDVTWRYSVSHAAVRARRREAVVAGQGGAGPGAGVEEGELVQALVELRARRQQDVSAARRRHLARRTLAELVQLMMEREPSEDETQGRISGAEEWRLDRGELGRHSFRIEQPGRYRVRYFAARDKYILSRDEETLLTIGGWEKGAYDVKNVFRKVENDWRMVYLARREGSPSGSVSWRISATEGLTLSAFTISASTDTYETGCVDWSIQFNDQPEIPYEMADWAKHVDTQFRELTLKVELTGGLGDVAWQHAQLFRQSVDAKNCGFEIIVMADRKE